MAKVTFEMGDELEFLADGWRFTLGNLIGLSPIDVQREPGNSIITPDGKRTNFPGQVVTRAMRLDFNVSGGQLDLTPADGESTIPPAASVENSQHNGKSNENT